MTASSPLARPFRIGSVPIPNRVVLAPMAGLTNSAYRLHMKSYGVGLVYSEMVSAYGLVYQNSRTQTYLAFAEEERPLAVQLFADDPEVLARAAELALSGEQMPDIVDLNMACPMRKVVRTGAGAAMLGEPERAVRAAQAVVSVASSFGVPVTVKLRSGLRVGDGIALSLTPRLQEVGVAGIALHPRAAEQFYHGKADHTVTALVVKSVSIPVMASGDINRVEEALSITEVTGAAAVMLARGAAGNPWLVEALLAGQSLRRPPLDIIVRDLRTLLSRVRELMGQERAARWIRRPLAWYLRGTGISAETLQRLRAAPDADQLDRILADLQQDRSA